jgi:hypothetical protein
MRAHSKGALILEFTVENSRKWNMNSINFRMGCVVGMWLVERDGK